MIDAVLQHLGIPHEYEPRLQIGRQVIHPDFSLGHGIYVEYWGLHTKRYLKYRRLKLELYKRKDLHLINIEDSDLKNILYIFTQQLHPFKTQFPQLKSA
jgi:predicted nuclease of restriction endonuclease-like RecB superfamily